MWGWRSNSWPHSPRIRGDGPKKEIGDAWKAIFSPYSRGWSHVLPYATTNHGIFPVFAGMVRHPGY